MTVCNMSIEAGARAGMIAPDETTFAYLEGRPRAPQGRDFADAVERWRELPSDEGAPFDRTVEIDASALAPYVTWGTNPGMSTPVTGHVPNPDSLASEAERKAARAALNYMGLEGGEPIRELAIDRAFIGSCTNGRIEDLRAAAEVARGQRIAPSVRAMVVPGSTMVKRQAEAEGLDRVFIDAGVRVAQRRLLDVRGHERRPAGARRALRLDHQPQLRRPPGTRRAHPSGEPRHGRRRRHRGAFRRHPRVELAALRPAPRKKLEER